MQTLIQKGERGFDIVQVIKTEHIATVTTLAEAERLTQLLSMSGLPMPVQRVKRTPAVKAVTATGKAGRRGRPFGSKNKPKEQNLMVTPLTTEQPIYNENRRDEVDENRLDALLNAPA
jgi:hypothetical protein